MRVFEEGETKMERFGSRAACSSGSGKWWQFGCGVAATGAGNRAIDR